MTAPACLAVVRYRGRKARELGLLCRRRATGFIAPGHPRCGYHLTEEERAVVLAVIQAERDMRALRLLEDADAGPEDEREPERHEDADGTTWTAEH